MRAIMFALVLCVAGCVPIEAVQHCDRQARNAYGLERAATTTEGRAVGAMELEAWRRQRLMLTGEDALPPAGAVYPPLSELDPEGDR